MLTCLIIELCSKLCGTNLARKAWGGLQRGDTIGDDFFSPVFADRKTRRGWGAMTHTALLVQGLII